MARYADDWVVLCRNKDEAQTALSMSQSWIADNDLELSPEKTHIGSSFKLGHGFEFLGYRFEDGPAMCGRKVSIFFYLNS